LEKVIEFNIFKTITGGDSNEFRKSEKQRTYS